MYLCFAEVSYFEFFFFKQKTAYEMRISDWSSDVCSSDLIDIIQIVIGEGQEGLFHHAVGHRSLPSPTVGGATRQQSVRNGLAALAAKRGVGAVLIHDAARPFLPPDVPGRLLEALDAAGGAVPVLPWVDSCAEGQRALGAQGAGEGRIWAKPHPPYRLHA